MRQLLTSIEEYQSKAALVKGLMRAGVSLKEMRSMGVLPPIAGGDTPKGYNERADFIFTTVDGYDLSGMWDEFQQTIQILNAQRDPLIDRLSFPVEVPVEKVLQISGNEFEEADEYGRPKSIRLGVPFNIGFDLKFMDLGIGYTYRFLSYSTAQQLAALNNSALEADRRLMFKIIMDRIFDNTDTTSTLIGGTAVNVYPFYNNDGVTPPGWKSFTHLSTHTHYLFSGNTSFTSANAETMIDHVSHHGYLAGGALPIFLCNQQEANLFAKFRQLGSPASRYDFIPKAGVAFRDFLTGGQPGDPGTDLSVFPGFLGMWGPAAIVQEDYIPAGYVVLLASGGQRNDRNPVGIRQHENPSARGLKLFPGDRQDYPLVNSFYHHALGAGIRHRGAGVVMKVDNSAYAIPTLIYQGPGGR